MNRKAIERVNRRPMSPEFLAFSRGAAAYGRVQAGFWGAAVFVFLTGCSLMARGESDTLRTVKRPEKVGVSAEAARQMEQRVEVAIKRGDCPGAVLLAAKDDAIFEFQAFGSRQLSPRVEMTRDTIFDLASVSKIVGTATATLLLLDDGKLRLDDRVTKYIPEFATQGKGDVTLLDLMTHRSGLKAYEDVNKVKSNALAPDPQDNLILNIAALPKLYPTREYSDYSCLNYLTLARINEIAAGESQQSLLSRRVWKPLGMNSTGYLLTEDQKTRLAPTFKGSAWSPGRIHDPLANYYGASVEHCPGNAGLFSTARDLAIFCQMILNEGEYGGVRVLKPETVRTMTSTQSTLPLYVASKKGPGETEQRGLGWIVYREGKYISSKAPDGSFLGHTGYTGTYVWIDKNSRSFLIFLANAVYAKDPPDMQEYRKEVTGALVEGIYSTR